MIFFSPVKDREKGELWTALQEYLDELSPIYNSTKDEHGEYAYPYFEHYFSEKEKDRVRQAYWLEEAGEHVGFLLINDYPVLEEECDYCLAEICIFAKYRRKGFAKQVLEYLFYQFPGIWQMKYSQKNLAAKTFWENMAKQYRGRIYPLEDHESGICFMYFSSGEH